MKPLHKIFLVDDEEDIRCITSMALETIGEFEVATATNAFDFLENVDSVAPDLVLLDVMMPELDGPSALEQYKNRLGDSTVPVIFMTAKTQTHEVEAYLKVGACGVIPKPFDPMTLSEQIMRIWKQIND